MLHSGSYKEITHSYIKIACVSLMLCIKDQLPDSSSSLRIADVQSQLIEVDVIYSVS